MNDLKALPWWGWVLVVLILAGQGTFLFLDARRRGRRPWVWGLLGLVNFPFASLLYWLVVVRAERVPRK